MSRFDPEIARYQTVTMQRLLDGVVHGYHHHAGGVVTAAKAPALSVVAGRMMAGVPDVAGGVAASEQGRAVSR